MSALADLYEVDVGAWLSEVGRLERGMRCSTPAHERFDRTARRLTVRAIRLCDELEAVEALAARLRYARYPRGCGRLDRVWTRAELGVLIVEATNRARILAGGGRRRPRGPRMDPRRIPDDRLRAPDSGASGSCPGRPAAGRATPAARARGRRVKRLAAIAALGPVTGPLALRLAGALARKRWALAGVYGLGIAEAWVGLPWLLARLLAAAHGH